MSYNSRFTGERDHIETSNNPTWQFSEFGMKKIDDPALLLLLAVVVAARIIALTGDGGSPRYHVTDLKEDRGALQLTFEPLIHKTNVFNDWV